MPYLGNSKVYSPPKASYFENLEELDEWASSPSSTRLFDNILPLHPRESGGNDLQRGKLLVCHDYKGGYTESPFSLCYTFNFWSSCDSFVYFSHHRITIPPPGWINASHRQGVKMLGTLIFEGGAEQDCLRLLVGHLPKSRTGFVSTSPTGSTGSTSTTSTTSLPISPHYARILADLAKQRGFDGYLLNFEVPLVGGIEQTRALAAWITVLKKELEVKVGAHTEVVWYDSVIIFGQLAWQDRLNSLNLPFFLSSSSLFGNYTWRNDYPSLTAQYFLSLDSSLTGDVTSHPQIHRKKLQDIYMGVDVWGRGSHGDGGFGSFKAISHIAPTSLGLSVALFGQAWTWESEQDKPGWNWDSWWSYERKLWTGRADMLETIDVPPMPPLKRGEPPCEPGVHDDFAPIVAYFEHSPPPNPILLPFHTTFSPGVGRSWFVKGVRVYHHPNGWTDVDKQTSLGDLVWPKPLVSWEGDIMDPEDLDLPVAKSQICMDDAWNGGSALRLTLNALGMQPENAGFRCVWIPVQSLSVTPARVYEASAVYKLERDVSGVDVDVALSAKVSSATGSLKEIEITSLSTEDGDLGHGWTSLKIRFIILNNPDDPVQQLSMGLVITIVSEDISQPLALSLLLGQMNVHPGLPPGISPHIPSLLWADFLPSPPASPSLGMLTWEISASLPPFPAAPITSPDDPIAAWPSQPSAETWFPRLVYSNIYALEHRVDGTPGDVGDAVWIGTSGSGYEGMRNRFVVESDVRLEGDRVDSDSAGGGRARGHGGRVISVGNGKMRFYVQGVTEKGEVLDWTRCVFVDV